MIVSFKTYSIASIFATLAVVAYATYLFNDLFPVITFLTRNLLSKIILSNFVILVICVVCRILQQLIIGQLRGDEVTEVIQLLKLSLVECLIVMGSLMDNIDAFILVVLGGVLLLRVVHWIIDMRVDGLTQDLTEGGRRRARRLFLLILITLFVDLYFTRKLWGIISPDNDLWSLLSPSTAFLSRLKLPMGYVFLDLAHCLVNCAQSFAKFCINTYEIRTDFTFPTKPVWLFFIEAGHDIIRIAIYALFTRTRHWAFFHMREIITHAVSLKDRVVQFGNYIRLSRNLRTKFPDATPEQLGASEGSRVCIICREDMETAKRLPCGHMFHIDCLHSWFVRSLKCPTCSTDVGDVLQSTDAPHNVPDAAPPVPAAPAANEQEQVPNQPNANVPVGRGATDASAAATTQEDVRERNPREELPDLEGYPGLSSTKQKPRSSAKEADKFVSLTENDEVKKSAKMERDDNQEVDIELSNASRLSSRRRGYSRSSKTISMQTSIDAHVESFLETLAKRSKASDDDNPEQTSSTVESNSPEDTVEMKHTSQVPVIQNNIDSNSLSLTDQTQFLGMKLGMLHGHSNRLRGSAQSTIDQVKRLLKNLSTIEDELSQVDKDIVKTQLMYEKSIDAQLSQQTP